MSDSVATPSVWNPEFDWQRQPAADRLVRRLVESFVSRNSLTAKLEERMLRETGTRLVDWVDHLAFAAGTEIDGAPLESALTECGFEPDDSDAASWEHPGGLFPRIVWVTEGADRLAIHVDSVADLLAAHQLSGPILGDWGGPFRRACLHSENGTELHGVERRVGFCWEPVASPAERRAAAGEIYESFLFRPRHCQQDGEGFAEALRRIDAGCDAIGRDWTCSLFFQAERVYWQSRNRAAQWQYFRQNRLGLGWGNHDHHTYRSSRQHFADLIRVFERLGFHCRERFYAGADAGWGAQVLEQPACGIVIFADVDLSPDELMGDFAHDGLEPRNALGTVGLWCQLHGEAFLQAGMHHLECQFDFEAARGQLDELGVASMDPFTNFEHLRQSFTVGERWAVIPDRVHQAVDAGWITREEADRFLTEGALGSHLEILERNDGFKGFNQTGVSEIILKTDPRTSQGT